MAWIFPFLDLSLTNFSLVFEWHQCKFTAMISWIHKYNPPVCIMQTKIDR
jgi:hypothetical protein